MIVVGEIVTLKENKDFRRIYAKGRSYPSAVLISYVIKNRCGCVRIGITTGKKIGKAVLRNRSRRIIREAYREIADSVKPGHDPPAYLAYKVLSEIYLFPYTSVL